MYYFNKSKLGQELTVAPHSQEFLQGSKMGKIYGGRWEVHKSLRPGGQAETFLVTDKNNPEDKNTYVLKRIRNPGRHRRFEIEINSLKKISHVNVVRLIDADINSEKAYLVTEYCDGGSMDDHKQKWKNDPISALNMFTEICAGVAAAHRSEIIH